MLTRGLISCLYFLVLLLSSLVADAIAIVVLILCLVQVLLIFSNIISSFCFRKSNSGVSVRNGQQQCSCWSLLLVPLSVPRLEAWLFCLRDVVLRSTSSPIVFADATSYLFATSPRRYHDQHTGASRLQDNIRKERSEQEGNVAAYEETASGIITVSSSSHDKKHSDGTEEKNEELHRHGWMAEGALQDPDLTPEMVWSLQQLYRSLDGVECDGLVQAATVPPIRKAPDCEYICAQEVQCEAWQWINRTCWWGNPFPNRCKGLRAFWPPRPLELLQAERDWYDGPNGTKSLWKGDSTESAGLQVKQFLSRAERELIPFFNRQVIGGRLRWFSWRFEESSWAEGLRLYSRKERLWDALKPKANDKEHNNAVQPQPLDQTTDTELRTFHETRRAYRVGHHEDDKTMDFCQRRDERFASDYPWARAETDTSEMRKTNIRSLSRYSLLRLRSAIPAHMRSGRFLNFGIGPCLFKDPMHSFFHHGLAGKDALLVDDPPMNGFGFERNLGMFQLADLKNILPNSEEFVRVSKLAGFDSREIEQFRTQHDQGRLATDKPVSDFEANGEMKTPHVKEQRRASSHDSKKNWSIKGRSKGERTTEGGSSSKLLSGCRYYRNTRIVFDTVTPSNVVSTLRRRSNGTWFTNKPSRPAATLERTSTNDHGVIETAGSSSGGTRKDVDEEPPIEFVIVDIDSHDYQIIREIVAHGPKVLVYMVEIATHFPPPFKYAQIYQPEEVVKFSEKLRSGAYTTRYEGLAGVSFSMIFDLLKDTHDFLMFPDLGDAVFAHKDLRPHLEREYGIRLPMDEFLCFAKSYLWFMYPTDVVRQWTFMQNFSNVHNVLPWLWRNVTASVDDTGFGKEDHSFSLYI
ncbi:unnamed protein product [Amoebophrya sp. A25]|nr:unnamed protein product [Amoebophrya sp. A25]|eukprot:GSA25T00000281001.1